MRNKLTLPSLQKLEQLLFSLKLDEVISLQYQLAFFTTLPLVPYKTNQSFPKVQMKSMHDDCMNNQGFQNRNTFCLFEMNSVLVLSIKSCEDLIVFPTMMSVAYDNTDSIERKSSL